MEAKELRTEAVAGMFYPQDGKKLEKQLKSFFSKAPKSIEKSSVVIVPHAGIVYSGKVAAYGFNALKNAKTFVILCPNHTGLGKRIAVSDAREWSTPLGNIKVDEKLAGQIVEKSSAEFDDLAHLEEHSIEVQLPFLQHIFGNGFKIVPVSLSTTSVKLTEELAYALVEISKRNPFSLIVSSDFSHFIPKEDAVKRDKEAIEKINALDVEGFFELVTLKNLSICGFVPIMVAISYCKKKGMKQGTLLKYDTSATVTGDTMSVVGYAAISFK